MKELMRYYIKYPGSHVAFCGRCGSCLLSEKIDWETTNIRLGLLDDDTGNEPSFHVYVASKHPGIIGRMSCQSLMNYLTISGACHKRDAETMGFFLHEIRMGTV